MATGTETQSKASLDSAQRAWLKRMGAALDVQVADVASLDRMQANQKGVAAPLGERVSRVGVDGPNAVSGGSAHVMSLPTAPGSAAPGNQPAVSAPVGVPRRPSYAGGEIHYQGVTLEKLKNSRDQNIARENAKRIREKIKILDSWARRVDDETKARLKQQEEYNSKLYDLQGLQAAFAKDKAKIFRKMSQKTNTKLSDQLAAYENRTSLVAENVKLLEAKAWRLAAAYAMVSRAEMLLESHGLQKDREKAGQEKAELEQKLSNLKGIAGTILNAAKDPIGTAKKIGADIAEGLVQDILVEIMGGGKYQQRIKEVENRIKRIDERLEQLGIGALKADLNAAINTVTAIQAESDSVLEALDRAKREQGQAIDHLADLERDNPNTTTMFRELQKYYKTVAAAGKKTLQSSREFEAVMLSANEARRATAEIRNSVREDRTMMSRLYDNPADLAVLVHHDQTQEIINYADEIDHWYAVQIDQAVAGQRQLQKDLMRNGHFDFINPIINDVQKIGLGHKQDDEDITK
jgi:hypothetical protein